MIRVTNLSISYGQTLAVNKLNLHIKQGEKVSIVGKSGCGKTSLLHALAGINMSFDGQVTIHGQKISGIRSKTAIILQKDGLFPWKNVADNILLGIINMAIDKESKLIKLEKILSELGIKEHSHKFLNQLSGGQRQRVAIARALIQSPDLLLMDEPTGSLDMITKESFQDNLLDLYKQHGVTSIIVTHDIEEAVYLGQKILVIDKGQIIGILLNPLYAKDNIRKSIEFYKQCLKVRQVMKNE